MFVPHLHRESLDSMRPRKSCFSARSPGRRDNPPPENLRNTRSIMRYFAATAAATLVAVGLIGANAEAHGCRHTEMVQDWYHRYLHRAPDPGGLQTWVSALRCGTDPAEVQASILASEEY